MHYNDAPDKSQKRPHSYTTPRARRLKVGRVIGEGAFGVVLKAKLLGGGREEQACNKQCVEEVAVKLLKRESFDNQSCISGVACMMRWKVSTF